MTPEEYQALAKRIARHEPPAQVRLSPDAARLRLIRLATQKLLAARIAKQDREFLKSVGIAVEEN